jgi:hypothetical protein
MVQITVKELLPIVISAAVWGDQWAEQTVRCRCDNAAVVAIVNSGKSKDAMVMHLMRSLFFFLAHRNIVLVAEHLPGLDNGPADALSRDKESLFHAQVPEARREATVVHPGLIEALVTQRPDWTSKSWTKLLRDIFRRV